MPLIMTHGWPGSVFELLKTVGPLTDPTAHGGRAEDAFHLVMPSMPGYGFSGKPKGTGWDPDHIARAWAELMKRLGYTHYVVQGGDWGAPISSAMARQAPAGLLGIHINLLATVPPEVAAVLAGRRARAGGTFREARGGWIHRSSATPEVFEEGFSGCFEADVPRPVFRTQGSVMRPRAWRWLRPSSSAVFRRGFGSRSFPGASAGCSDRSTSGRRCGPPRCPGRSVRKRSAPSACG